MIPLKIFVTVLNVEISLKKQYVIYAQMKKEMLIRDTEIQKKDRIIRELINEKMRVEEDFALMKKDHWVDNPQRSQSNNTIVFETKPSEEACSQLPVKE